MSSLVNQPSLNQQIPSSGQRRTYDQRIHPLDISNRFSSKHDLYVYLDEHLVSSTSLQHISPLFNNSLMNLFNL